jgi:hypothetical protein
MIPTKYSFAYIQPKMATFYGKATLKRMALMKSCEKQKIYSKSVFLLKNSQRPSPELNRALLQGCWLASSTIARSSFLTRLYRFRPRNHSVSPTKSRSLRKAPTFGVLDCLFQTQSTGYIRAIVPSPIHWPEPVNSQIVSLGTKLMPFNYINSYNTHPFP